MDLADEVHRRLHDAAERRRKLKAGPDRDDGPGQAVRSPCDLD
jgi:hypothetical protein